MKTAEEKKVKICVPIIEKTYEGIIEMMKKAKCSKADVIEWRADYFEEVNDISRVLDLLKEIKEILNQEKELIFTYRTQREGGLGSTIASEYFLELKTVILSRLVDMVDVEMLSGNELVSYVLNLAKISNVKVILSNHDFESTPRKDVLVNRFKLLQSKGADIVKISVMARCEKDVETLEEACKEVSDISPVIAISMGELGKRTRIHAEQMGSVMTFASLEKQSAPGQIPIDELYELLNK